jgi:hypothetical protein
MPLGGILVYKADYILNKPKNYGPVLFNKRHFKPSSSSFPALKYFTHPAHIAHL